ncbi:MAG: hypothetical protein E6H07_17750 [Bacteroidetes bacterium]|nr:MAG: hypothetical protein E6H07_17750 [Bacteroidota bacterium]
MKELKTGDFVLQLLVILIIIIGTASVGSTILMGLFLLGGVQILSVIVHLFHRDKPWISPLRKFYYWLLLLPLGGFIYALNVDHVDKYDMPELEVMFYVGIVSYLLGIFYFIITIIEWRKVSNQN